MRESAVEKAICAFAKENNISTLKIAGANERGKADRLFMKDGVASFLEVKRPGEAPTGLQLRFLRLRTEDGFAAEWCDNIADGVAFLRKTYGI